MAALHRRAIRLAWEHGVRHQGEDLTVHEYMAIRMGSGGASAAAGYLEAIEGIELTGHEWASPQVVAATEAGLFAASLDNDRYSYTRDSDRDAGNFNLIGLLQREKPLNSSRQTVIQAVAIRDRILLLYLRLREQLWPGASQELRCYLGAVDRAISGNIAFGTSNIRYLAPGAEAMISLTEEPSDASAEPLPYPTIAWWWSHLDQ
jgi:hypothetical protein